MKRRLNQLGADRSGAALVEFAIILPLLVLLFLGTFEATRVVRVMMKVSNAAQTYASLVAAPQTANLSVSNLTDFCVGSGLVLTPFSSSPFSAAVASLSSADGATWTQMWHDTTHCGSGVSSISGSSLASGVTPRSAGDAVIVVKTQYNYQSPIVYVLPGSQTLSSTAFARPRSNAPVVCSSCSAN